MYADKGLINFVSSFKTFALEDDKKCRYDYVEPFSGTGQQAQSLGRFCGKVLPPGPLASRAHKMMVKFHSDEYIAKRGFQARFTSGR